LGAVLWDYTKMLPGRYLTAETLSPDGMYNYRTQLGNTLLSRGRVVITDRLHASIMSTLIDRPVVYIDNSYKKLTRIRGGLEKAVPECNDVVLQARYAESLAQAVGVASSMLEKK
jgi:exopolysaccharide biosynthesis predicted pyruvyltransferase EpsI